MTIHRTLRRWWRCAQSMTTKPLQALSQSSSCRQKNSAARLWTLVLHCWCPRHSCAQNKRSEWQAAPDAHAPWVCVTPPRKGCTQERCANVLPDVEYKGIEIPRNQVAVQRYTNPARLLVPFCIRKEFKWRMVRIIHTDGGSDSLGLCEASNVEVLHTAFEQGIRGP